MRRMIAGIVLALVAAVVPAAGAEETPPTANVHSNATIVMQVSTNTFTNFEFSVTACPEGQPITITWEATQPDKGDTSAGEATYFSGPDNTQRFIVTTVGAFSPGYRWVGTGTVTCGPVVIPVTGSGTTKVVS